MTLQERASQIAGAGLRYRPLRGSAVARDLVESSRVDGHPFCAPWQGDLLFSLVEHNHLRRCLQIGFGTGSTAAYLLRATAGPPPGAVTSIDWSPTAFNRIGIELLRRGDLEDRHTLIEEPSLRVLPRMVEDEAAFDFVFVDGWKTFDHLAAEAWFLMRLLDVGGFIMFDDTHMDSVDRLVSMLEGHYGLVEIPYSAYGQTRRLRAFQILSGRMLRRPYRAFQKVRSIDSLPLHDDWDFYRRF